VRRGPAGAGRPARAGLGVAAVLLVVLGLLAALMLDGCGIPTMNQPAALDSGLVPRQSVPVTGAGGAATPAGLRPSMFFVFGEDQLRAVHRDPAAAASSREVDALLAGLVAGPTDLERGAGLSTAIPPGLTLHLTSLRNGQAVVDLTGQDPGPALGQAHLAAAQIVLTLTALPDVESVILTRNGRPLEAALPDGSLTSLPLTHDDYASLLAR
jgi:Sporulation and spore germination